MIALGSSCRDCERRVSQVGPLESQSDLRRARISSADVNPASSHQVHAQRDGYGRCRVIPCHECGKVYVMSILWRPVSFARLYKSLAVALSIVTLLGTLTELRAMFEARYMRTNGD